jgi:DNA-binding NarL/FixJ family response regulator
MLQRHCVLFVKHDPEDADAFRDAFTRLSEIYALQVVSSGAEAISYIKGIGKYAHRKEYPTPTVVVTGASEQELRAVEWLRGQRELDCVRVVVLVESEDEDLIRRAYQAGAHSCLLKSEDLAELREILTLVGRYWIECNHIPNLSESLSQ